MLIVNVRGVEAPMEVLGVMRGRDLPASILAAAPAEGPKTTALAAQAPGDGRQPLNCSRWRSCLETSIRDPSCSTMPAT